MTALSFVFILTLKNSGYDITELCSGVWENTVINCEHLCI